MASEHRQRSVRPYSSTAQNGDAVTADHTILNNRERISFAALFRRRGAGSSVLLDSMIPHEEPNCAGNNECLQKCFCQIRNHVSFVSLGFIRACEDLCWNFDKSIPHRSEPNGLGENEAMRAKEGFLHFWFSQVFQKSGGRSCGMLLLFGKHTTGRQKVTV